MFAAVYARTHAKYAFDNTHTHTHKNKHKHARTYAHVRLHTLHAQA